MMMKLPARLTPRTLHAVLPLLLAAHVGCAYEALDAESAAQGSEQAIVNGQAASISDHPWQVAIEAGFGGFCGATIIAPDWVLTANHCVEGVSASSVSVFAGMTRLSQGAAQSSGVSQIVRAPGYQSPEVGKDAALLRLSEPFSLGGNVQAIDLVTPADAAAGLTDPGVVANVSGWGALDPDTQQSPDQLQAVDVVIRSMNEAESFYGNLTDDQLPAGGDTGDSCQGDSGGPLTVDSPRGPLLAGIVSWGSGCADGPPGLYGRVSVFHDFIVATMNGEEPPPPGGVEGWMCPEAYLGDGECDCGCGAFDGDCPSNSVNVCQFNNCDEWQPTSGLQLNSADPTQCEGGVPPEGGDPCPPNSTLTPDGAGCACDAGFAPNAQLTECVPDGGAEGEGEGEGEEPTPPGACPDNATQVNGVCLCNAGFDRDGDACVEDDDRARRASDDPPGCASASSATPVAAFALALVACRRRRR